MDHPGLQRTPSLLFVWKHSHSFFKFTCIQDLKDGGATVTSNRSRVSGALGTSNEHGHVVRLLALIENQFLGNYLIFECTT